jgi:uncharacterized protein YceH (UPF0502 family)
MDLLLTETEIRVLGCLLEKEMATPEYYPLSLNALVNACNQKTNRFPIVSYDENTTTDALAGLKEKGLAWQSDAGRVAKYAESFVKKFNLVNREAALLCVLMLRGSQTPGELRGRTERLHPFADLDTVIETLESLSEMECIIKLPRQPGCKESRYTHLLAGKPETSIEAGFSENQPLPQGVFTGTRMDALEEELANLLEEFNALKKDFFDFKGQF